MHSALTRDGDTLHAAVIAYLDWHALRGSTPRHRSELRRMLTAFQATLSPGILAGEVAPEDCSRFLRSIQDQGRRPNTLNAYHRTLDSLFNWLVEDQRLPTSPMRRVPKPKVPQEQIKPLLPEELAALLAQPDRRTFVGARDALFIALLADTGLRLTEATTLRLGDFDMRLRSVNVLGKGSKPRTVFYGEAVARQLKEYLARRGQPDPGEPLFISSLGEPLCRFTMGKRLQAYGKAARIEGKRVSPHTLRHTFAVSWLMGGGDAFSLQRLLGHTTAVMTARYVNFTAADLGRLHRSVSPLDRLTGGVSAARPVGRSRRRLR